MANLPSLNLKKLILFNPQVTKLDNDRRLMVEGTTAIA